MSASFRPYEPDQMLLLPENLREWLAEGHLAFFVMDVVRELDLKYILRHYERAPLKNEKGQVIGERAKAPQGKPAYDPRMMTALLLYGYATGVVSSRQIEKKCGEDVALDGTKVRANASKHKAMSYGHMVKRERELQKEIDDLLRRAQEADEAEDQRYGKGKRGDELPPEPARRESRLEKIREAKAALEARARAEAQEKRRLEEEERQQRERDGDPPKPGRKAEISEIPADKTQRNFTDPESRIMKNSDKAFLQGYNAQAAVDHEHQVIVAADVSAMAADTPHLKPMVAQIKENTGHVPKELSADAGYFSEDNVKELQKRHIDALVAAERKKHGEWPLPPRGRIPEEATVKERMIRKLRTVAGRTAYALRKITVEPVFGQIRTRGLVRFWLRGLENVKAEWSLWCTTHNLLKLFRSGRVQQVACL